MIELKLLTLLLVANGAPILARRLLGDRLAFPIDGNRRFIDGRPILGPSKTVRGALLGIAASVIAAPALGLGWPAGAWIGGGAMLGDLMASFIKRRLGLASSGRAPGLDQIPESLLPLLLAKQLLGLDWSTPLRATLLFVAVDVLASRLLYRLRIREHPY